MRVRIALTTGERALVARGQFVRVDLAAGSILVGKVDGAWCAYENECRHRALPIDLGASSPMSDDANFLLCHQHGALYRLRDGLCVAGPCVGEKLASVEVSEEGADLVVRR